MSLCVVGGGGWVRGLDELGSVFLVLWGGVELDEAEVLLLREGDVCVGGWVGGLRFLLYCACLERESLGTGA